jgi:hypothetical protein
MRRYSNIHPLIRNHKSPQGFHVDAIDKTLSFTGGSKEPMSEYNSDAIDEQSEKRLPAATIDAKQKAICAGSLLS